MSTSQHEPAVALSEVAVLIAEDNLDNMFIAIELLRRIGICIAKVVRPVVSCSA
jgi:hypothetical protein